MKTTIISKLRVGVLLFGATLFAANLALAQSSIRDYMQGGGCPFCSGGGQYGDNAPPPDPAPAPAVPTPTAPAVQPAAAPSAVVAAVVSSRVKPGLTKEQAMALAAQIAAATPNQPLKRETDGYWNVSFGQLASYRLDPPAPGAAAKPGSLERIPAPLQQLDGQHVRVRGFMLPLKVEGGLATEFLIVRNPMVCCYGMMPAPNEWVCVKTLGKGVPMQMDVPLVFSGTLHVGEIYENSFFIGVYQLDAEKVAVN